MTIQDLLEQGVMVQGDSIRVSYYDYDKEELTTLCECENDLFSAPYDVRKREIKFIYVKDGALMIEVGE